MQLSTTSRSRTDWLSIYPVGNGFHTDTAVRLAEACGRSDTISGRVTIAIHVVIVTDGLSCLHRPRFLGVFFPAALPFTIALPPPPHLSLSQSVYTSGLSLVTAKGADGSKRQIM